VEARPLAALSSVCCLFPHYQGELVFWAAPDAVRLRGYLMCALQSSGMRLWHVVTHRQTICG